MTGAGGRPAVAVLWRAGALVAFNGLMSLFGLWPALWWLAVLLDFVLVVLLAEAGAALVPAR